MNKRAKEIDKELEAIKSKNEGMGNPLAFHLMMLQQYIRLNTGQKSPAQLADGEEYNPVNYDWFTVGDKTIAPEVGQLSDDPMVARAVNAANALQGKLHLINRVDEKFLYDDKGAK